VLHVPLISSSLIGSYFLKMNYLLPELSQYRNYATGWTTGVRYRQGAMMGFFLFPIASKPTLDSTRPPVHWMPDSLNATMKLTLHESDYKIPCSPEVKNAWSCTSSPQFVMSWCLVKHSTTLHIIHSHNIHFVSFCIPFLEPP
jgi:hypothetical protein